MPKVGDRHFPYTPEGLREAEQYSASTGIPLEKTQKYNLGGAVRKGDGNVKLVRTRGSGIAKRGCNRRVRKSDAVQ